ncbi:hypothetical protein Q5P01_002779 [Channa striata]|uniref:Immunoglobulin V-set domain-containing protein n=1 Tax=Channa striata TaxID=64152 RepID=A0AA88NTC8_CHASR|nr:hypothetical protein Q5P01_002779 [Channa striata]
MIRIFVLVSLTSSVCGMSTVTPVFHQTEETNNIVISWDSWVKTDLSLADLACFFNSKPLKVLYQLINGVEVPESQHKQFAGRVQLDRDALREGRVRIHLSTVTAEDSGNYWCKLGADYDKNTMGWSFLDNRQVVLNVDQNNDGERTDESPSTFGMTPAEGRKLLDFLEILDRLWHQ